MDYYNLLNVPDAIIEQITFKMHQNSQLHPG